MRTKDTLGQCLYWLATDNGITTSYEALTEGLPLVQGGLTPSLFARAAQRVGLVAELVQRPLLQLNSVLFPCVLLLKDNQACILQSLDRKNKTAQVLMPELGMQGKQLTLAELAEHYAGHAFYCSYPLPLDQDANSNKPVSMPEGHWFWRVILQNRGLYRDVVLAGFFINLFALVMPLFVMNVYDRVVPNHATDTLWMLAAGALMIVLADLVLKLLRSWYIELAANRADLQLSAYMMERILGMQLALKPQSVGSFAANVSSFESVRAFIGSMTVSALIDLPFFLLFVVIIAVISPVMVIPIVVGALLIILYALSVQAKMRSLSEVIGQASAQRNSGLFESLSASETLKSFNATHRMQGLWEQSTRFLSACSSKMRLLGASLGVKAAWIQQSTSIFMIIVGVYQVIQGEMSQGALIACYMLSTRALAPITQVASLLSSYYQAADALNSVENIVNSEQERPGHRRVLTRTHINGEVRFNNVSFSYPDEDRPALQNISFHIRAGEKVGIIGAVGSGKSTLEKLILGLYAPSQGQVLIDGQNLQQMDPAELRNHISYLPQEPGLLSGSLYENITLGIKHPDNQHVLEAVNAAGLASLVGGHPDGLGMQVGEQGGRLSGGQRQAVAAARAFVRRGSIFLLDEPTSAMDSTLENTLCESIIKQAADATLILVTHKQGLLRLVDRLIIMDQGRILADGPKENVLDALSKGTIQRASA